MRIIGKLLATCLVVQLSGCAWNWKNWPWGNDDSPSAPAPGKVEAPKFKDQPFHTYDDVFQGRIVAPNISSSYSHPEKVLGVLLYTLPKAGKTCQSTDADDFTLERGFDYVSPTCKVLKSEPRTLTYGMVKGGTSAKLKVIVGETAADAEYAFEMNTGEPGGAIFDSPRECAKVPEMKKASIPAEACSVFYTVGVVQSHFFYKAYKTFKGSVDGAFSGMTVGGTAYTTAESGTNKYLLTVDTINVTKDFKPRVINKSGDGEKQLLREDQRLLENLLARPEPKQK